MCLRVYERALACARDISRLNSQRAGFGNEQRKREAIQIVNGPYLRGSKAPGLCTRPKKVVISFVFFSSVPPFPAPPSHMRHTHGLTYTRRHARTYVHACCRSHIASSPPQTHAPYARKELTPVDGRGQAELVVLVNRRSTP